MFLSLTSSLPLSLPLRLLLLLYVWPVIRGRICVHGLICLGLIFFIYIPQVGSERGGEQLVAWPEAMGLIIQLPSHPGWLREHIPRPGRAAGSSDLRFQTRFQTNRGLHKDHRFSVLMPFAVFC